MVGTGLTSPPRSSAVRQCPSRRPGREALELARSGATPTLKVRSVSATRPRQAYRDANSPDTDIAGWRHVAVEPALQGWLLSRRQKCSARSGTIVIEDAGGRNLAVRRADRPSTSPGRDRAQGMVLAIRCLVQAVALGRHVDSVQECRSPAAGHPRLRRIPRPPALDVPAPPASQARRPRPRQPVFPPLPPAGAEVAERRPRPGR